MQINDEIISIKDLHKYYGAHHILQGINLQVNKTEIATIIGRSGCGKTTLLRCLNCLEILDKGNIRIAGITISPNSEKIDKYLNKFKKNVPFQIIDDIEEDDDDFKRKKRALRTRVGMLFQNFNLFPHKTVLENITTPLIIVKKLVLDEANKIAMDLLDDFDMTNYIKRYPHQISGGQIQRVAIARALAMSPTVMLYDEPTSALDPELSEEMTQIMLKLKKKGLTQIVVSHSLSFAKKVSSILFYMESGKIIDKFKPTQIDSASISEKTMKYLNLINE